MFKRIKLFFLKLKLTRLCDEEVSLNEKRAKLVYQPDLKDIPEKLDKYSSIGKQIKKINKKIKKIKKSIDNETAI
jgi:type I restriction-modification system DNA methylase subunit